MKNWPAWIPVPNAWMSAVLLVLLTGSLAFVVRLIWQMGYFMARFLPPVAISFGVLALLSPIVIIAIFHHLLHLFLDRFFPETRSPEMDRDLGWFPSLMSWWEGLMGWSVILLATLTTLGIVSPFLPSWRSLYPLYSMFLAWDKTHYLFKIPTVVWVIVAAYVYHFEHVVRHHLLGVGAANRTNRR